MKTLVLIIAALCFMLTPSPALACSCGPGDPPAEFNRAAAVFIGRVLEGTQQVKVTFEHDEPGVVEAGNVRFLVETSFKGELGPEVTLVVDSNEGTSCGPYGLSRGERYVVYAYASRDEPAVLYTGVCTRTAQADGKSAKEDLEFLRNLPAPGSGATIRGSIWADLRADRTTPLADVTVTIRGSDDTVLTVKTDADGNFAVSKLKAGTYRVEPEFPPHYTSRQPFEEVTAEDRGAVDVAFEATLDGRISGRVVDEEGRGFDSASLAVEGTGRSAYGHSTGENGGFRAEGLPPGEYVLSIEMRHADYAKNKPYYFPGTFDRAAATSVKVGLGESVEDLVFRLPAGYGVRTIEGKVLDDNGKPAARVEVLLLCPRSSEPGGHSIESHPPRTLTDEQGLFRIGALTGETYWIEARGARKSSDKRREIEFASKSRKLVVTEDLKDITLVLSLEGRGGGCPE